MAAVRLPGQPLDEGEVHVAEVRHRQDGAARGGNALDARRNGLQSQHSAEEKPTDPDGECVHRFVAGASALLLDHDAIVR